MGAVLRFLGLFLSFLILASTVMSQSQNVDIDIKIVSRESKDAYVVGDTFYYTLLFNNNGNSFINDTFKVYLVNPHGDIIQDVREHNISLEPNQTTIFFAKGGKENETAAFPFDTTGDYHVVINSTKQTDFYRRFGEGDYTRYPNSFNYVFDVMPKWQYTLWKQTSEANNKVIEANTQLLDLTSDLNEATKTIKDATIAMLVVALINLLILLVMQRKTVSFLLKTFFRITLWVLGIIVGFLIIGFILHLLFD